MRPATSLLCALSPTAIAYGQCLDSLGNRTASNSQIQTTCHQIAAAVSNVSQVYFPPAPQYLSDISHVYATSSQESGCSVEPGSAEDVGRILVILGSTRTPFAVKGGGHTINPGFSSTRGVQISMTRFNEINVNSTAATVELGPGLTWDQVYAALDSSGVNVIGGRVPGIGVAGLTLGGGYSWKTNQYGLTVDNIVGYELVLPNGTITSVTPDDADLWFGLRGGLNNFGIVTKFIFKSYPQSGVWGGFLTYPPNQLDSVKNALVGYQQKNDVKAACVVALLYTSGLLVPTATLFYDAPTPPPGIFDDFLAIPTIEKDLSSRSFSDLVLSMNIFNPPNNATPRAYFNDIPVTRYSPGMFDAVVNQTMSWGARLSQLDNTTAVSAVLEVFDSGIFSHGSGSAYPPDRSQVDFPAFIGYTWTNASLDHTFALALREESNTLHAAALADGQNVSRAAAYVNYAMFDTPLEDMYGANVPRLRMIRAEIDPEDVMGLAGGFKF